MKRKKGRSLKNMDQVRDLLADTIRKLEETSSLDEPETAKLVISASRVLGDLIRGVNLEDRLDKLEQLLAQQTIPAASGFDFTQLSQSAAVIPVISSGSTESL